MSLCPHFPPFLIEVQFKYNKLHPCKGHDPRALALCTLQSHCHRSDTEYFHHPKRYLVALCSPSLPGDHCSAFCHSKFPLFFFFSFKSVFYFIHVIIW